MIKILFVPYFGIREKPDRNVPTILPNVDMAYKLPTVLPEDSKLISFSLIA